MSAPEQRPGAAGHRGHVTVLMLGTLNSPHLEHLAQEMARRGFRLHVAGDSAPSLPAPAQIPGAVVHTMPSRGRAHYIGPTARTVWLMRLMRRVAPDVVFANGVRSFAFDSVLARARTLISMGWGSDVLLADRVGRIQNRVALRRSALVLGDSPMLLERMLELGAPPDRLRLVHWGVDLDRFRPGAPDPRLRASLGIPDTARIMLSPRALAPVYNIPVIVEAFDRLADDRPDLHLVLKHFGAGAPRIPASRHADRVHPVGFVDEQDLPDLYRLADLCVSVPSSDSGPRTVWEALACGCPCLVSDLPWVSGLLHPGREVTVTSVEPGEVAQNAARLLDDPAHAAAQADAGRDRVLAEHDRRRCMDDIAALIDDVLNTSAVR